MWLEHNETSAGCNYCYCGHAFMLCNISVEANIHVHLVGIGQTTIFSKVLCEFGACIWQKYGKGISGKPDFPLFTVESINSLKCV